jgi:hypothetical protein
MDFLIIAIDHTWQLVFRDPFELAEDNRTEFAALLSKTIEARKVDLICEESDPCQLSIAQKIAYEHRPRLRWKNIHMSAQERLEAGIWEALLQRPYRIIEGGCPDIFQRIDRRIPEDATREQFFAAETIRETEVVGAKNILVLCGDLHADSLGAILEATGSRVEVNHSLIHQKNWE